MGRHVLGGDRLSVKKLGGNDKELSGHWKDDENEEVRKKDATTCFYVAADKGAGLNTSLNTSAWSIIRLNTLECVDKHCCASTGSVLL